MKKQTLSPAVFFAASILLLTCCGILLFVLPQRTYSENENRYLTTFQPPTISGFLDISLQQNLTDGANDQFAGRDLWMKFSTSLQRAAGFQDIGGVYLGKDGYYFERILDSDLSETRFQNNLDYLDQFAQTCNTAVTFLPVPSKGTVLETLLPENAVLYDADRLYSQAAQRLQHTFFLDIRSVLLEESNSHPLYFKTDHHWTMDAAYLAYTAWCKTHQDTTTPLTQFTPTCVSEDFYGTLYSKAPDFHVQPDRLVLPSDVPQAEISIEGHHTDSIYEWSKLKTKDKYGVYFGGNFGKIEIHTKNSGNGKTLLVIKDSFANSLIPFLMADYENIIMLDFRYYNQHILPLIQEICPDETLILYEMSNFAQDSNFFKILK